MFSLLLVTLPTQPNAVRLRIWRALKSLGCVALRDGAYVLPAEFADALEQLAEQVNENGGSAQVMALTPKDDAQKALVTAQFDRTQAYAEWHQSLRDALEHLPKLSETDARKRVRMVGAALQTLRQIDYYPGAAAQQAEQDLQQLKNALDQCFSKGEPQAVQGAIKRLKIADYQGKQWATRARPWVDRLACTWLITRFIDAKPTFLWLQFEDTSGAGDNRSLKTPKGALGFDYDGARFTHVGNRVSFEVLMASFGLEANAQLTYIARAVHYLDAGGIPVPMAVGLEAVLGGLREVHTGDDALIQATHAVFDALYAHAGRSARVSD